MSNHSKEFAVLPLRDVVVYPHMVIPLFVGQEKSIAALDSAMEDGKQIFLVGQKDAGEDSPSEGDVHRVGTISNILQLLKLPDGTVKVAEIESFVDAKDIYAATVKELEVSEPSEREGEALTRALMGQFDQYAKLNKKIPPEIISSLSSIDDPSRLGDTIAAHINVKMIEKQKILEIRDLSERLEFLIGLMEGEIDLLEVEKKLRGRVKKQMEKSQREYYLNEQMKAIQNELGESEEGLSEFDELAKKIAASGMPKEALEKAEGELKKLRMMSPMSAEAAVVRNYIDWVVGVPWKKRSKVRTELDKAEEILDEDHYGLEKVKERVLEYLAVQKRVKKLKGPILCLVGPPGVGKTSLGRSIARATNRKFVRMSLGGVRDEAEIRGHRRTYVGAMPGKIVQNMSKIKTKNPLFLLDEIDKMAMDFRGDPGSALLEVLDPEQNTAFNDHYLELDYDLSEVMFVTTANTMNIPAPLMDRMEVINISGYTEEEKTRIALKYLVPKQLKNAGLKDNELKISESAVRGIIRYYSREAGVRSLERQIANICRKVVRHLLTNLKTKKISVTEQNLDKGDVMQESIKAAMTVVRSRATSLGIAADFHSRSDVHFHVPEGATPKDGPSAGIGMCVAMVSALTKIPVKAAVAMTGEITLRGEVLPIGGLKEKLLAALRGGIKQVIIPKDNERDLTEIPSKITKELEIIPVKWIDEVFDVALRTAPKPLEADESNKEAVEADDVTGKNLSAETARRH